MQINSTVQQTTFGNLNYGDIFTGTKPDGNVFLGMKVATREQIEDDPSSDVVVFGQDKAPSLYTGAWTNQNPRVVLMQNMAFVARPEQPTDLILDIKNSNDPRGRAGAGCAYLIGNDVYLGVEVKFQSHAEQTFYVNVKTGDCWHSAFAGSLDMRGNQAGRQFNLLKDGAALPRWQIVETDGEKRTVIAYELPDARAVNAA